MSGFTAINTRSSAGQATVGGGADPPKRPGDDRKKPTDRVQVVVPPPKKATPKKKKSSRREEKLRKRRAAESTADDSSESESESESEEVPSSSQAPSKAGSDRRPAWLKFLDASVPGLNTVQWDRRMLLDIISVLQDWALHPRNSLSSGLEFLPAPIDNGSGVEILWRSNTPSLHVSKVSLSSPWEVLS
jgi:hypothetical protein